MAFPTLKNRDLYDFLKNQSLPFSNNASKESLFNYIKNKLLEDDKFEITIKFEEILQSKISNFCSHLSSKWQGTGVRRIQSKFLQNYATWLDAPFSLSELQGTQINVELKKSIYLINICDKYFFIMQSSM